MSARRSPAAAVAREGRRLVPRARLALAALAGTLLLMPLQVSAQAKGSGIYTCIDDKGRRLTSDRPIPECTAKEQKLLNRDGSVRGTVPPTLTPEERLAKEAQERKANEARLAQADATRRDRSLMSRYPDEAAHRKARESSLDTVRLAAKASETRLKELARERKPLMDEAEFYKNKTMPAKLKAQLDAVDAAVEAQRAAGVTQEAERARINRLYDIELERLRRLWAGAAPGSMGPLPSDSVASAGAAR